MKILFAFLILVNLSGCFYAQQPADPSKTPMPVDGVQIPFDYSALAFYGAQIVGFARWMLVEWKHKKLVKAGKKDINRDGKED